MNHSFSCRCLRSSSARHLILPALLIIMLVAGCTTGASPEEPIMPGSTPTVQTPQSTSVVPSSVPSEAASLSPPYLTWVDPDLPSLLRDRIAGLSDFPAAGSANAATLVISADSGDTLGVWIYLAVAPFYSQIEGVKYSDLRSCWESGPDSRFPFTNILLDRSTARTLGHSLGDPDMDCVQVVDEAELPQALWENPEAVALIPFESAAPAFKILEVDSQDPLSKSFDLDHYQLVFPFFVQASFDIRPDLLSQLSLTNFNQDKLTEIALTGVTALVRDTAVIMEDQGLTYPAEDVRDILTGADITHINNEVPFAENCPPPTSSQDSLRFCSSDDYLELLEDVGTDIVELSGDHFGDWGPEAMLHTLDLYRAENWLVYGGGENLQAGLAPVFISDHGNRFAFIGCNGKSFDRYATASATNPGASRCDFEWMVSEIQQLTADGYLVIATMQHEEVDSFYPVALQEHDFRLLADAGAVVVSGSQAHHPQAFEYTGTSFIHYGLGNMFFDQWYLATRVPDVHANKDKSFIDLHYFYDGRYIGTRLIPLQFIDNARPRPMTPDEADPFLNDIYEYSLWEGKWVYLYPAGYYVEDN